MILIPPPHWKNLENSNSAKKADTHPLLLYTELDLDEFAILALNGVVLLTLPKKKENSYKSDADDSLNEEKRRLKLRREKKKPPFLPILGKFRGKSEPIPNLFDYYHGEEEKKKNNFNIGKIEQDQNNKLQELLEQHLALFV
ncbi:18619_t:CDS:2 [Gigaspora margarita]|uniref:18619_t:CDS:1 n=1 Tax=Gigaspora margarita TaxID=4874 RepID=A0ABM8W422_GIGMA|nr:18619_t:CDS:2 [Gigaspora margarita]